MSIKTRIVCDNTGCNKSYDPNTYGAQSYHELRLSYSDFTRSMMKHNDGTLHFCSSKCIMKYIEENFGLQA